MAKHHFWKYQFIKLSTLSYDNALPFYYAYIVPLNKIALMTLWELVADVVIYYINVHLFLLDRCIFVMEGLKLIFDDDP